MNTPVTFPIAKLLKEKKFNLYCNYSYWENKLTSHTPGYALEDGSTSNENYWNFERYYAPTIAEIIMWLYEKHGIWITADFYGDYFKPKVINKKAPIGAGFLSDCKGKLLNSPTEAYLAAIEYVFNKLI